MYIGHEETVYTLAYSSDGKKFASGGYYSNFSNK